ncbi:hypothetical protein SLEP1_g22981 [Rubroshorea leprosula]|uniref:Uncharacterized protein n=1 Tax=Rubroshorea leprosula TaxID=152421 RepID=A0AAV5JH08_9ROSI|nr:hypothetical protein SLEP1_g22981 [Rubroshorea leprosula]
MEVDIIGHQWSLGSLNWVDFCHGDLQDLHSTRMKAKKSLWFTGGAFPSMSLYAGSNQ